MASDLFQSVTAVFDSEDWQFAEVEGREVIRAGFESPHARVDLHVQVYADLRAVSVVSESGSGSENPAVRERIAELAMRANERLNIGNFEILWDSGRVLFRVTNLFPDRHGHPDIIRGLVHTAVAEMDRFTPALAAVLRSEGAELAALDIDALLSREEEVPTDPPVS